jgi:ribosomal protein S27E
VNTATRSIGYLIVGLFGVLLFVFGGSLVIWALHYMVWYPPSSEFLNNLPYDIAGLFIIATPLGLFLIGFGILLIVWSGAGLSLNSQTALALLEEEQEETKGILSINVHCPHCNAIYVYRFPETASDRTVTCQNCGRHFEAVESQEDIDTRG